MKAKLHLALVGITLSLLTVSQANADESGSFIYHNHSGKLLHIHVGTYCANGPEKKEFDVKPGEDGSITWTSKTDKACTHQTKLVTVNVVGVNGHQELIKAQYDATAPEAGKSGKWDILRIDLTGPFADFSSPRSGTIEATIKPY